MKIHPSVYLLIIVIYFGVKYNPNISMPQFGGFGGTKEVVVIETKDRAISPIPSNLQSLVQPLTDSLKNGPNNGRDRIKDATILGDLCGDFAKIVIKPNDAVRTNVDLREVWKKYLVLHNSNSLKLNQADYNDLAKQLDSILMAHLGAEPKTLESDKVVDIFTAMQGAFYASRN